MGEFVHMELNTSDSGGAKAFYAAVFGWSFQDMPMPNGTYTMIMAGKEGVGGLYEGLQPGAAPNWLGYVGVASLKATIDKVEKAGGKVVMQDVVPGMGSFAVFVDPQGAAVAAWEAAAPAASADKSAKKKTGKKKAEKAKSGKNEADEEKAGKKKADKKKADKKKAGKKKADEKKADKKKAAPKDKPKKKAAGKDKAKSGSKKKGGKKKS